MEIKIEYNETEETENIKVDAKDNNNDNDIDEFKVMDVLIKTLLIMIFDNGISKRKYIKVLKKYYKEMKKNRKNG